MPQLPLSILFCRWCVALFSWQRVLPTTTDDLLLHNIIPFWGVMVDTEETEKVFDYDNEDMEEDHEGEVHRDQMTMEVLLFLPIRLITAMNPNNAVLRQQEKLYRQTIELLLFAESIL